MKYRLTEAALQDVRDIVDHIREIQKSPQNAQLVATRLKEAFEKLASSPSLSHVRRELQDDNARVYTTPGVLIIYDPTHRPLVVLRVIHGARDLWRAQK